MSNTINNAGVMPAFFLSDLSRCHSVIKKVAAEVYLKINPVSRKGTEKLGITGD